MRRKCKPPEKAELCTTTHKVLFGLYYGKIIPFSEDEKLEMVNSGGDDDNNVKRGCGPTKKFRKPAIALFVSGPTSTSDHPLICS
ncbi:hypothetical protein sscle_09g069390 [Sclerotinia sclerotiorum 1980 UF-70]|uniref:Uncharacterized protein n=1 Tax=Sclerotinia sclerotiorum (strain ATCC 18683 / 1980 / Ss-1) TaxID=665079 RepID=A0A1D9QBA2_SCLS1|nr:hypothetical protein sscle_09g069390 [Sclerotinia sclerotiorum 1980 UF-70]